MAVKNSNRKLKIVAYVHMFPPEHNAGSETTLLAILRGMAQRGHECRVLASEISHDYEVDGVKVFGMRQPQEPFAREQFAWSDVAITHLNCTGSAMRAARDTAKPLVHLVHNHFQLKFHHVRPIRAQLCIFNTEWVRRESPMDPSIVLHPIIEPEIYAVPREGERVSFVNLTVTKGANVFYELSRRLRKIHFLGVKGAYGEQYVPAEDMPNVTIWEHTPDIQHVYRQTKVILMPSDYESFGRIAVEAACSGIPSIVHPTEGLKEALGPAGIYRDRDKIDDWEREIKRLYSDSVYYEERSAAALSLAKSLQPQKALDQVEAAVTIVANAGLEHAAWAVEALGEEEYIRRAVAGGYFDPRREPAGYRPALGAGPMKRKAYVSDRKLCVNGEGKACEKDDPNRVAILCGPGATIPFERAVELGLISPPTEEKREAQPMENKMISGPVENKSAKGPRDRKRSGRRQQSESETSGDQQPLPTEGRQSAAA